MSAQVTRVLLPAEELESRIGYQFKNKALLKRALTHRSFASEHNERLEFLGDSVLNCVIGHALFLRDRHFTEGVLSRVRSNLVCEKALDEIAAQIQIGQFIYLGEGELKTGGADRPSILADACEAVFGAVFLDGGFEEAQHVILRLYECENARTPVTLTWNGAIASAEADNCIEEKTGEVEVAGNQVRFTIKPYEVKTIRIR